MKGTWSQALWAFAWPILLILGIRWALVEPYVIPSGSMIPNLLVSDHIFVQKSSFGLRFPFSDRWFMRWGKPHSGDVIVFRYPESPSVFYIKRLIGEPGDQVRVENGRISVNGRSWSLDEEPAPAALPAEESEGFVYFQEQGPREHHLVRFMESSGDHEVIQEWTVPEGHYFFMGDNRDQSSDSRAWGFVPESHLIGKAWIIWLSCDRMLESARFLCDPSTLRWNRMLTSGGLR
ncbi:MAG TPA: signal peptidase I [Pseudobdellovibrionaceae bacterium]|nr:signal peptidase I [Pseudobdellovibrionaceae bacterium]